MDVKRSLLGYAVIALCLLFLEGSTVAVQALHALIPDFELSAIRYIGVFTTSAIWVIMRRQRIDTHLTSCVPLIILSMTSFVYNFFYFFAVAILPLSHAEALMVTSRLISFVTLATLTKRTITSMYTIVSMGGCTLGIMLIIQPWKSFEQGFIPSFLDRNTSTLEQANSTWHTDADIRSLVAGGYFCVIASGAVDALYFYVSAFYLQAVPSAVQCFVTACFCFPASLLVSLYTEELVICMTALDMLLAAVHSISAGLHLMAINASFQLLDSVQVSILMNFNAVLILIPQYTLMRKYLYGRGNIIEVVGCLTTFGFISLGSFFSRSSNHDDFQDNL